MLSFDTSSTITGYAYWENGALIVSGVLSHVKEKNTTSRIENMTVDIINLLKKHKPDIVVVEQPPLCNSPKTCVMLAELVGCVKGYALFNNADYVEFKVNEWRKLIAGKDEKVPYRRNEAKEWAIQKVLKIHNQDVADDNEADAILIGQARINQFINI